MREVPYETDHDVRARSRRDRMYERINDFLARGGRGRSGRGGRGRGMMNRIGYRTYDNYEEDERRGYDEHRRGYDDDERMLLMRYKFCYIPKERLLNNSSLSFIFKIKFLYLPCNIKLNAYGNLNESVVCCYNSHYYYSICMERSY